MINSSSVDIIIPKEMKLGKYQHSKTGNFYSVIGIAKHSETLEDLVVYKCLYYNPKSMLWVRPMNMFLEYVEIDGKKVPRFVFIEEYKQSEGIKVEDK